MREACCIELQNPQWPEPMFLLLPDPELNWQSHTHLRLKQFKKKLAESWCSREPWRKEIFLVGALYSIGKGMQRNSGLVQVWHLGRTFQQLPKEGSWMIGDATAIDTGGSQGLVTSHRTPPGPYFKGVLQILRGSFSQGSVMLIGTRQESAQCWLTVAMISFQELKIYLAQRSSLIFAPTVPWLHDRLSPTHHGFS